MSRGSVWTATLLAAFMSAVGVTIPASAQDTGNGYPDNYDYGGYGNDGGYDRDPYAGRAFRPFAEPDDRRYREPQAYSPDQDDQGGYGREPGQPQYVEPENGGRESGQAPSDEDLGASISRRTMVEVPNTTNEPPGTIVIDTASRHLYYTQPDGQALQYGIGVGRQGFAWKGVAKVQRKSEWPDWIPPSDMLKRRPDLPLRMSGGIENPLGARALYLFQGNRDTMFRIHGTNEPDSIGKAVSSGCIRMMNGDVIDLYKRVPVGTRVVVL